MLRYIPGPFRVSCFIYIHHLKPQTSTFLMAGPMLVVLDEKDSVYPIQ